MPIVISEEESRLEDGKSLLFFRRESWRDRVVLGNTRGRPPDVEDHILSLDNVQTDDHFVLSLAQVECLADAHRYVVRWIIGWGNNQHTSVGVFEDRHHTPDHEMSFACP